MYYLRKMMKKLAIIEVGSNVTKIHVYDGDDLIYEKKQTIEFKKNYFKGKKVDENDIEKLSSVIEKAFEYTDNIHVYGCSIFRNITEAELDDINFKLFEKFNLKIEVVSQEDEAFYTAMGVYGNIDYDGNICVFIGGGGSIELIFVNNRNIIGKEYYDFGVVDVTNKFKSLKEDVPSCTFDEVYGFVDSMIGELELKADVLVLAGGDHLYWYDSLGYKLDKNSLYDADSQRYMVTREISDCYDKNCFEISLNKVKEKSDDPAWFDGARSMKVVTNLISHKIDAKYIVPTRVNMEEGIKCQLMKQND